MNDKQNIYNDFSPKLVPLPIITLDVFAHMNNLPIGVIEANCDRQYLPTMRIGKRRYINLELLRKQALSMEMVA